MLPENIKLLFYTFLVVFWPYAGAIKPLAHLIDSLFFWISNEIGFWATDYFLSAIFSF